ncbi:type 2 periplasmic-binding domain-containing protein, partial [Inquilinus limosus]
SLTLMTAILAESDCLTLLARSQARLELRGALVTLPVRLDSRPRMVGTTIRSGWLPTRVQRRFLTLLRQECRRAAEGA